MGQKRESDSLKGYKVDITTFEAEGWLGKYHSTTGEAMKEVIKVPTSSIMIQCLFHPSRQVSQTNGGVLARRVAGKLTDAKGGKVTLNEDEHAELKTAVDSFPGFQYHEFGIVDRVHDAEETTLKAAR